MFHVREVLPGDEPLACQLGDANLELESVKQRNAKLVEAAKRLQTAPTVIAVEEILAVLKELEAEVGDE